MERQSRVKWCLLGCLIIIVVLAVSSIVVPDGLIKAVKFAGNNGLTNHIKGLSEAEGAYKGTLIEMVVESIGISATSAVPVVVLKDKEGKAYLPIFIGAAEANAISVVLEGVEVFRPLTPDLLCSIIDRTGARVAYITIDDLRGSTFYATVTIVSDWRWLEIDARPSDAIAIALRVGASIYVEKSVLNEAGILPDREAGKPTVMRVANQEP